MNWTARDKILSGHLQKKFVDSPVLEDYEIASRELVLEREIREDRTYLVV